MNSLAQRVLSLIQTSFPAAKRPYAEIAQTLNATETQVMEEIAGLKARGIIRRIGAVFEPARLGYVTTLAGAAVPAESIESFAAAVNALPEVTHHYQREHSWNLWFTLAGESMARMETVLDLLRGRFPGVEIYNLPAVKKYKLRVDFRPELSPAANHHKFINPAHTGEDQPAAGFSEVQKKLVRTLQEDIPLESRPFLQMGRNWGQDEDAVLRQIRNWIDEQTIRRFGAVVRHQKMGYVCNAMLVMAVPGERVDEAGAAVSNFAQVSHCYQRVTLPAWPYNLYAMIHGRSRAELTDTVQGILRSVSPEAHAVLPTIREFKKTSMRYFAPAGRDV